MAIDAFTSSAAAVSTAVGAFTDTTDGTKIFSLQNGWCIRVASKGVTISKATSFGGTQVTPPWPVSLDAARSLAHELIKITN